MIDEQFDAAPLEQRRQLRPLVVCGIDLGEPATLPEPAEQPQ